MVSLTTVSLLIAWRISSQITTLFPDVNRLLALGVWDPTVNLSSCGEHGAELQMSWRMQKQACTGFSGKSDCYQQGCCKNTGPQQCTTRIWRTCQFCLFQGSSRLISVCPDQGLCWAKLVDRVSLCCFNTSVLGCHYLHAPSSNHETRSLLHHCS